MYNISELSSMSDEQLKGVAEAMGLTKIDLANRESAVYEILDQQALNSVATAKNRKQPSDKPKAKRGRPAKATEEKSPAKTTEEKPQPTRKEPADMPVETAKNSADEKSAPKRRGRKPKAEKQTENPSAPAQESPAATETQEELTAQPDQKPRRGRKPKNDNMPENGMTTSIVTEETPLLLEAPHQETLQEKQIDQPSVEPAVNNNTPQEIPAPQMQDNQNAPAQQPAQPRREFGRKDAAFGSFFPRGEGRKFTPRTQREKEAAAAAPA